MARTDHQAGLVPARLKQWRSRRGPSQLDLALAADVSARHISFLETGRSQPGRSLVLALAGVFRLEPQDLNTLLVAAGFAPDPLGSDMQAPEMRWLHNSLELNMRALDPWSATVQDKYGNLHLVTRGWLAMLRALLAPEFLAPPINSYHMFFAENGFPAEEFARLRFGPVVMKDDEIRAFVAERGLKCVAATVGEDEHSVGMREIIDIKHGGLEKWGFSCEYLGTSVPVEKVLDAAIEHAAQIVLISTIITHGDMHRNNMEKLADLAVEKGVRDKLILISGGTQVTDELARSWGMDAGFGRGTKGINVASFVVETLRERGR